MGHRTTWANLNEHMLPCIHKKYMYTKCQVHNYGKIYLERPLNDMSFVIKVYVFFLKKESCITINSAQLHFGSFGVSRRYHISVNSKSIFVSSNFLHCLHILFTFWIKFNWRAVVKWTLQKNLHHLCYNCVVYRELHCTNTGCMWLKL